MTTDCERLSGALSQILDELQLSASDSQRAQLLDLILLLQRWNSTYNLTAVRDIDAMLIQHVADCLAVIAPLDRWVGRRTSSTLLDVGSGAGFPGSVIAVMRPALRVTCVDSVGKKAAFIRQCAGALGLMNLSANHGRVQDLNGTFDVITSRAFSDLSRFVQLTTQRLAVDGFWMAMKGKQPIAETERLAGLGIEFHVEQLAVPMLDAERCLIWMKRLKVSPSYS